MKLFVWACLTLLCSNLQAQIDSAGAPVLSLFSKDGSKIGSDARDIFLAPFRFDSQDWLATAAIAGGTVLLLAVDEPSRDMSLRNESNIGNSFAEIGKQYGRELYGLSLAGGLYVGGLASRNDGIRVTGLMLFESVAMAGIVNIALKTIIGRKRPYTGDGAFSFRGMQTSLDNTSLPSGHSTVAFSVSSVLANRIQNTYASIGLYSLATLTAVSRVYNDYHWVSDTFLGAAIGTAVGLYVSRDPENESYSGIQITTSGNGFRIEYCF